MENNNDKMHEQLSAVKSSMGSHHVPAGSETLVQPWQRLAEHLSPLIGDTGFCALYGRAIRLAVPQFDWLQAAQPGKSAEQSFIALAGIYSTVDVQAATAANTVLLTKFTALLSDLIGQTLTGRLLDLAWNGKQEQTNAQERKP